MRTAREIATSVALKRSVSEEDCHLASEALPECPRTELERQLFFRATRLNNAIDDIVDKLYDSQDF